MQLSSAWQYSRGNAVRRISIFGIADYDSAVEQVDVQRVVDHVHVICRRQRARDAVNRAGERRIRHAEGCLPDLNGQVSLDTKSLGQGTMHHLELGQDVRNAAIRVRPCVEESDDSLSAVNELAQRRPLSVQSAHAHRSIPLATHIALFHGHRRRRVHQVHDTRVHERGGPHIGERCAVGVCEDESDDLVRVCLHPSVDSRKVVLDGAAVEENAVCRT